MCGAALPLLDMGPKPLLDSSPGFCRSLVSSENLPHREIYPVIYVVALVSPYPIFVLTAAQINCRCERRTVVA
jgi:hypothetical protein